MRQSEQLVGRKKNRSISSFLKKTFQILQNPVNYGIVQWADSGIGFVVVNEELFSKQVLPLYFKHSNYSSFVRQLNMYNFHKIRQGTSESYFYHQKFDRRDRNTIAQIKRKPEKKKRKFEGSEDDDDEVSIYRSKRQEKSSVELPRNSNKVFGKIHIANSQNKGSLENTMQLVLSEHDPLVHQYRHQHTEKNILSMVLDDDRLSINQDITQRCPRLHTRQLIYPSNGLLPYSYPAAQLSNFSLIL